MRFSKSWLVAAAVLGCLSHSVLSYPAPGKIDAAEELISEDSDADYQYDEVELKPEEAVSALSQSIKRSEVATETSEGSGSEPARKDDVAAVKAVEAAKEEVAKDIELKDNSKIIDNPESDESESPASGEPEEKYTEKKTDDDTAQEDTTSGDDTTDAGSANGMSDALEEGDAPPRDGMTAALEEDGTKEKRDIDEENTEDEDTESDDSEEEDSGSSEDGSTPEGEDKGQENEAKKTDIATKKSGLKKRDEGCDCCEEPDEEHEHEHQCCGKEECCHGGHCCEHEHCHDKGHHEHEGCCHHHGHHHGFVHEWGEECCGDHHCHDCCGEHEHEHHHGDDHEHEHCHDDHHCCHHKEEEDEPECCCCGDRRSKTDDRSTKRFNVPGDRLVEQSRYVENPFLAKKQTVHVGYGYASGDNYRLGYQQGGMGGLASTFTGQVGPETQNFDFGEHFNKRRTSYRQGPIREKRFYGGHAFGNMESGMAHGSATPYGHPVTHPGFTTMGFPGHALASQDVRNRISHPHVQRRSVFEEDYPLPGYTIWRNEWRNDIM